MPDAIEIEIKGLDEARKKAEQLVKDMFGEPMLYAMRTATLHVQRRARQKPPIPVDTGRLRASITPEIRSGPAGEGGILGVIGSNVEYAPYQELGTGEHRQGGPVMGTGIYRMPQMMMKLGIRRGGIRPKRFLQNAIEENAQKILKLIQKAVDQTVRK